MPSFWCLCRVLSPAFDHPWSSQGWCMLGAIYYGRLDYGAKRHRTRCTPKWSKYERFFTAVTPHNPSISGLPHDHPSSVARQQRKKPDPWPPQATWALKIALLGAHAEHVPRGALEELRHSTLLLRPLSVLCSSHLQVVPRLCGGIDQHVCSPTHIENIGP